MISSKDFVNSKKIVNRKHYDKNFKKQLIKIYNQCNHSYRGQFEECCLSALAIRTWVIGYNDSKSFNLDDNRTEEEKDLIELRKKVKQPEMENDIFK